jgi:uncharacterized protein YdaU (DUF1376 family)
MAALPYMPLYVADYLADAAHLSTMGHGAYLLLIMTYWHRGEPLPDDERKLARIARMTESEWQDVRDDLREFFDVRDGQWTHNRIERELDKVRSKSNAASDAGKASARKRLNERSTDVQRTFNHTDTDTDKKETTLKGASANEIDQLENQCREAAGCETSPSPSLFDLSPIRRCLAGGASLEMDILPALRAIKARGKSISSWKYAEQTIMDAKASREAPAMAGNVTIPQPRGQPPPGKVSNNRRILDALNAMEPHDATYSTSHDGPVQISTARPVLDVQHGRQGRTG